MGQMNIGSLMANVPAPSINSGAGKKASSSSKVEGHSFSKEFDKAKSSQSTKENDESTLSIDKKKAPQSNETTSKDNDVKSDEVKELDQSEKNLSESNMVQEEEKVNDEALAFVSQMLNIPVEQISQILEEMECTPQDLLKTEVFSEFLSKVYPESNPEELLVMEDGIKNISKIMERLEGLYESESGVNQSIQPHINQAVLQKEASVTEEISVPILQNHLTSQDETKSEGELERKAVQVEAQVTTQAAAEQNLKPIKDSEDTKQLAQATALQETNQPDLGIVVPVHNFTSSKYTQMWQSDQVGFSAPAEAIDVPQDLLIKQIDIKQLGQTNELHLQLTPKELGTLSIKMVEVNGNLVADIKVDNEKTKAFILNEVNQLKAALEERGLNVSDVKVDIRQDTSRSQMEQQKQKSSRRIQEIISKHMQSVDELEQDQEQSSEILSDSEVDYMV